jgi:hypothetical protein
MGCIREESNRMVDGFHAIVCHDGPLKRKGTTMKSALILPFVLMAALVSYLAYAADQWLGVVAFKPGYVLFCVVAALLFCAAWFACFRKHSILVGAVVFGILAANLFLPAPSERLLREVMLKVPPGTDAGSVEEIVKEEYAGSDYPLPLITRDRAAEMNRVHVSLSSQEAGNSTSLLFLIDKGTVVRRMFIRD